MGLGNEDRGVYKLSKTEEGGIKEMVQNHKFMIVGEDYYRENSKKLGG